MLFIYFLYNSINVLFFFSKNISSAIIVYIKYIFKELARGCAVGILFVYKKGFLSLSLIREQSYVLQKCQGGKAIPSDIFARAAYARVF